MGLPKRKPTRLKDYDYNTPGAYFITICVKGRKQLLSKIIVGNGVLDVPENKLSWQTSLHDHTIRGDEDYSKIWEYIDTKALKWEDDCFYN